MHQTPKNNFQRIPTRRFGFAAPAVLALTAAFTVALTGCSDLGVKPWERDLLAKPEMQLMTSPVDAGLDDHVYFSKEASSGGRGFGGGGCGCN
jgi:hypothetical protein